MPLNGWWLNEGRKKVRVASPAVSLLPPKFPGSNHQALVRTFDPKNVAPLRQNTSNLTHLRKVGGPNLEDELRSAQALPVPHVPRPRRDRATPYENDALEGRLLAHLEPLKADVSDINIRHTELHREIAQSTSEARRQSERLEAHDSALQDHNELHEGSMLRIAALEKEVKELRAASRSPPPSVGPRSPSARSTTPPRERNIEEELQLAIGGWEDCRRDEAVQEAKAIFKAAKIPQAWL